MFQVNNKKTIYQLSSNSFKSSKMRNLFAIVAIILTTVLFTGFFTIANSLLDSMEESTMRQVGGSNHGGFKFISMEEYDILKTHPSIKSISYSVVLGSATNQELAKRPTEIRYISDAAGAKDFFAFPTTGRLPQQDDEIATDTLVLDALGIPAKLGEKVTLEYRLNNQTYHETFTLVGFWKGDKICPASQAWLNQNYVKEKLEHYIPSENDIIGSIQANVNFSNSFNIEGKLLKVLTDSGYTKDEIAIGINWAYTGNSGSADFGTMLGGAGAILLIIFCGYLIISNVFYISVAKDIQFYGLLKTIGTTGKQIKILIRRQVLLLCLIGIPFGLLGGYVMGAFLTPIVLSISTISTIKISLSPFLFIASALFATITVFISIAKPSKLAAKVSPIEALRSSDATGNSKRTNKKSHQFRLFNFALSNVFRNKKKVISVTISLSLSLIILNIAYSMANSFDMDKYLKNMIGSDFAVGDVSNFNVYIDYSDQDTLSEDFLSTLSSKNGIETLSNIYFAEPPIAIDPRLSDFPARIEEEMRVNKEFTMNADWLSYIKEALLSGNTLQHLYGIDEATMNLLEVFSGNLDFSKLETGNYVIAAPFDADGNVNYYNIGDKVSIANFDGVCKEYEVLAIASIPYNISNQHSHPLTPEFYLASNVFLEQIANKAPMLTTLNVSDNAEAEMEAFLSTYCESIDSNMQYVSKATLMKEYENTTRTYKSIGIILSSLIAFIGIMNFINTIITSIMSRKQELAMLQSIGMTNKQTEQMLIYEGVSYTLLTALFALAFGSILGYLVVSAITSGALYISLAFTVIPSLLCLPFLTIISILVPFISKQVLGKHSIVERLREVE